MTTDFYRVISSRRSIRKYKSIPVEEEKLMRVLDAARMAPSANNLQPWHFIVVKDENIKVQLKDSDSSEWFYTAPVIICVCIDSPNAYIREDGRKYQDVDAAIAFDHLVLAATAEGLGTCWIDAFDPVPLKEALNIPDGIEPLLLTPLGYPDESPAATSRKNGDEIYHWDRW